MGLIESKVQIARFRARAEREEEEVAVEGPLSQEDEGECGDHGSSTSNSSEAGGEAASSSEDERPITPLSSETASSDYEPPVDIAAPAIAAAEETENRSVPICGELFFAFITVERVATKQKEDANKSPPVPPLVSESGDDDRYDLDEEEMERRQRCAADVGDEGEGESDDESVTTQSVEGTTTAVATAATIATTTTTTPTTTTPTTATPTTATPTTTTLQSRLASDVRRGISRKVPGMESNTRIRRLRIACCDAALLCRSRA
ncbi:hypothetical protein RB195_009731 [Necator americanus]|uniref:Uncharacterized protein n=1 Tax=Necator americanus TaxID=51031 RepID=A0ABR1CUN2_NECAM